jgi:hypothetical protein
VPAVVVSAHSHPGAVSSVVYDHTSILATIQAKWNLPAMTFRDANAATLAGCLDLDRLTFADPPKLAAPSDIGASEQSCSFAEPKFTIHPATPPAPPQAADQLVVAFFGRRHRVHGALVRLHTRHGTISGLTVELLRGKHVAAHAHVAHVGRGRHSVALRGAHGRRLPAGRYTLVVRHGRRTLARRRVHLG